MSQFPLEGEVQHGGQEGVQIGGGFGLQTFQGINFYLDFTKYLLFFPKSLISCVDDQANSPKGPLTH
jgi:hypothetical protein